MILGLGLLQLVLGASDDNSNEDLEDDEEGLDGSEEED